MPDFKQIFVRYSPKQLFFYWKAGLPTQHLLSSIDQEEFRKLLKYKDDTGHPQYKKYFNAPYWLRLNVQRALYLGLNRAKPMSILDIGSGFGYFPYAAHFYGHEVVAIDLPGDTLFEKAAEFFKLDRRDYTIKSLTKIKSFKKKFDLVTAFQVCFNGHIEGELWGLKEWQFFVDDLFAHQVNPGGKIYLELNWSQHLKRWLPEEVEEHFKEQYEADFDGPSRVTLYHPERA